MRRLPIYFIVSTSNYIDKWNNVLNQFLSGIRIDPFMLETAYISIITSGEIAKVALPLTESVLINIPTFKKENGNVLGTALNLLMDDIDKNVVKTTMEQKGDWKPIVILLVDGMPTDNISQALERWKHHYMYKSITILIDNNDASKILETISNIVLPCTDIIKHILPKIAINILHLPIEDPIHSSPQEKRELFNKLTKNLMNS